MANYSQLKAAIADVIKTNGTKAITGQVLQDVLNSMVSVIGANYTFAGVATPSTNPSTPDQNVVYMASQGGTYTNFSNIEVPNGISLLLWNGTWSLQTFFVVDDKPTSGSENIVKSKGTFEDFAFINKQIGYKTLEVVQYETGYYINDSGNRQSSNSAGIAIRVFDVSGASEIYFDKVAGSSIVAGVFCTDYTDINNTKISVMPKLSSPNVWVNVPAGAVYAVVNVYYDYEPNNIYLKCFDKSVLCLKKDNIVSKENREDIEEIVGEYVNLPISKSYQDTQLIVAFNRLTFTTNVAITRGYAVRVFNVEGLTRVKIDKSVGGILCGCFCRDASTMLNVLYTNIGGGIQQLIPIPQYLDVPETAKYLVVNSYPSYAPNDVYAKVLAKPFEDLNKVGELVYDILGTKTLPLVKTYDNSTINDSGVIQTGQTGYTIRVFNVSQCERVFIDKYIGNLNYCGVFCTNKDDIISSKVGDFVPKQTTPAWLEKPSTALYMAVNSYPSYAPNDIYVKSLTDYSLPDIENSLSRLNNKYGKKNPFKCVQWNVGQFGHGAASSTITPSNYNQMVVLWNKEVVGQDADVCGLIEYNPVFGINPNNETVSPDDVVWNNYVSNIVYRRSPTQNYYGGNAVISNLKVISSAKVKYECFVGVVAPDTTTQTLIDEAFYTVVIAEFFGIPVKILECSIPFNVSNPSDNTYQRMAYTELAETFANEDYVIIMGDFELVDNDDYDIFIDEGYTLANGGSFGWFATCPDEYTLVHGVNALDNIIVKGFTINSVQMGDSTLSDHFPLFAELEM